MSGSTPTRGGPLRKDQIRALTAFKWAESAKAGGHLDPYTTAVQTFAASLLRGGLAVAVSVLERDKTRAGSKHLLHDLALYLQSNPPSDRIDQWPGVIRGMPDTGQYMRATREFIALLTWLQRACRALKGD